MYNVIIRGGYVAQPTGVQVMDIALAEGGIAALGTNLSGQAEREIDAAGLYVMPGVIDSHVHFNEPGRTEWEGIATGSAALAAGGGTLFIDMPLNSSPPVLIPEACEAKKQLMQQKSVTDYALWGGLTPHNLKYLPELAACGVVGFKAFMSRSGIEEFAAADDATLLEGMKIAAHLGLPVAVHAESDMLTHTMTERALAESRTGIQDYLDSRPPIAEEEAITRAVTLAYEAGAHLHVVHVSSKQGIGALQRGRRGKRNGRRATLSGETCLHYLFFTDEDVKRQGAVLKCAPPIRSQEHREALLRALLLPAGPLAMLASDHSPAPATLKGSDNFFEVWGGISGVQFTLGAAFTLMQSPWVQDLGVSFGPSEIAALCAEGPAQTFSLPNKGQVAVGYDADLTLVSLTPYRPEATDLYTRHPLSPYLYQPLRAHIRATFVRGKQVFDEAKGITPHPSPQFVRPQKR